VRAENSRPFAVFTIVQDEPEFIHPWVNHYRKHVADAQDIFVLLHANAEPAGGTGQPSPWDRARSLLTLHHGVSTVPVHHASSFDHRWLLHTVETFYRFLLQSYVWVLFAEVDEFVLPMPGGKYAGQTLHDIARGLPAEPAVAVRATGFEIVQGIDEEAPVGPQLYSDGGNTGLSALALIRNRRMWYRAERYAKTLLANTPLNWEPGFHTVEDVPNEIANLKPSPDLALVHLHKADFHLALGRSRARNWSKLDVEQRLGWQNRIDDASDLLAFWQQDVDTGQPFQPGRMEPIASGIKDALG
jgi:hypothetical protein